METSVSLLEERFAGTTTDDDWRRLVDLYEPLLRAWMARMGVAVSDADDLAQEVLLVVFREIGLSRRQKGAFGGWLRAILVHRVRDYFRSHKFRPTATGDSDFLLRLHDCASELSRVWDLEHDRQASPAHPDAPSARRLCPCDVAGFL